MDPFSRTRLLLGSSAMEKLKTPVWLFLVWAV